MYFARGLLLVAGVALLSVGGRAADSASDAPTLMTERGKLLFADAFDQAPGKDWRVAKGKWEAADGALKGAELKADMHGAVMRHVRPFHNVVIQYSFKLDGARTTTLSINDAKGHCCRLALNATGFGVQKDSHDHNKADKAAVLQRTATALKPGEWHTVVLEIQGKEILARLDGELVAYGSHDSIDVDKTNFGLTVAGESASFKNLRVWEAQPKKGWEATRAKLAERTK